MSSNVLIPGAVVVVCLLIIFAISLGDREKPQPSLSIASPQKKERNQSQSYPIQRNVTTIQVNKASRNGMRNMKMICYIFEILDSLIFKGIEVDEKQINQKSLTREKAGLEHPSPRSELN